MKRFYYILALAGIVAIACSKEIPTTQIDESEGTYTYVINATMDSEVTKTAYADDKTFSWSKGDQISVLFHKDDDNKFFTLTAVNGGSANTRFQGEITTGYTIGASDDGTKWALYPANANHVYDATAASDKVKFYIPAETDFTAAGAHRSVNMPMEARGDADDNFTFRGLTTCYKFTFTGLTGVSKVKLTVENTGNGYYLSGRSPIRGSSNDYYLQMYEDSGSKIVSIIDNVSSGTATFFVNARCYNALQSSITLLNLDAGENYENIIYQASSTGTGLSSTSPATIARVPALDVSSYGVGVPFISKFGVNWGGVTTSADGSGAIQKIKGYDKDGYLYLYLSFDKSQLNFETAYTHYHKLVFYLSDGSDSGTASAWNQKYSWTSTDNYDWFIKSQKVSMDLFDGLQDLIVDKNIVDKSSSVFLELKINRAATIGAERSGHDVIQPATTYLAGTSVYVAVDIDDLKVPGWSRTGKIGYGPASGGDMLQVAMTALP